MLPLLLWGAAALAVAAASKALSNNNKDKSDNSENSKYRSQQQRSKEYSDSLSRNDLLSHKSNSVTTSPISRTRVRQNYAESILTESELLFASQAHRDKINDILYNDKYFRQLSGVKREEYLSQLQTNDAPNLGTIAFYAVNDFGKERCKILLKQNKNIFSKNVFYIQKHIDNKNDMSLLLYNNGIVLLLKNSIKGGGIALLRVFQRGRDDKKLRAQNIILSSSLTITNALKFCDERDYSSSIDDYVDYIEIKEQIDSVTNEINKVKQTFLKRGKKPYEIILEYLNYQRNNEVAKENRSKENAVAIVSCERNVRKGDKPTYTLSFDRETTNYFDCENSESIYVRVASDKESKTTYIAKLEPRSDDDRYVLTFESQNVTLDYLQSGVVVWQSYNFKHITEQINSVNQFIKDINNENNIVLDLLTKGVAKPAIERYSNIDFRNNNIVNEAESGTQQNAVRMALGNNDNGLVLIQGPPGTGKTTVIVEIIQQLAKEHKRVLVCSQSNSAVENIEKKLSGLNIRGGVKRISKEDRIEVDKDSQNNHEAFIRTNQKIMILLNSNLNHDAEDVVRLSDYGSVSHKYKEYHNNIIERSSDISELFKSIKDEYEEFVESGSISSYDLRDVSYLQYGVVLATCISAGLNIRRKKIFDTVIIDEAGKADLAETVVPFMLANRVVLVGDHKQLPPYMDREDINKFCEESKMKIEDVQQVKSTSMFQLYHENPQMPEECKCLLNCQFRMNEQIGHIVSDVFYDGDVMMGGNIAQMTIEFDEPYNRPVVVVDTSLDGRRFDRSRNRSFYNTLEVNMIFDNILPKVVIRSDKSIGILTFYNEQRRAISQRLVQSNLRGNKNIEVCTLDSIQGREFDIVILSAVRSFSKDSNCSIGFISDMRRLNVALSRAKSKLIIIGDFSTLCNEKSYRNSLDTSAIKLFKRLSQEKIEYSKIDNTSLFKQKYKIGDVIEAVYNGAQRNRLNITIDKISFMICRKELKVNKQKGESLIVKYVKDHNDKPIFIVEGEYLVRYATKFIKNNVTYIRPSVSEMPDIPINFGQRINKKMKEDILVNCTIDRSNGEVRYSIAECDMSQLVEGKVIKGVVNTVELYGLFVDIGTSKNGLIHISSLRDADELNSYHRGDIVGVVVNAIDYEKQRISLTLYEE